ncbi:MAG: phytoene/squalene synthase family protein [Bdellovibrionaceae bacterium]|nr:phytoene/squalene synthase family protein [Pseudobdellovibrionaceae bacterium]MDW8190409.1 phytoene/squalene synthase family protein [Pseudobdellovibrionaceae bacterium]
MTAATDVQNNNIVLKEIIANGSKSFYFASHFLPPVTRRRAWALYAWCRFSDDYIDKAPSSKEALVRVHYLNHLTQLLAHSHQPSFYLIDKTLPYEWHFLRQLLIDLPELNHQYLIDLIRGYEMDVAGYQMKSLPELIEYCYCVAGTVGLLMAQIMGVRKSSVLEQAKNLGIALQLTNIIRDIPEDLRLGRIYIPREFFNHCELNSVDRFIRLDPQVVYQARKYLFQIAENYYDSGLKGSLNLSWREGLAVTVAALTYQKIGKKALSLRKGSNVSQRIFTTFFEKVIILFKSFFSFSWKWGLKRLGIVK